MDPPKGLTTGGRPPILAAMKEHIPLFLAPPRKPTPVVNDGGSAKGSTAHGTKRSRKDVLTGRMSYKWSFVTKPPQSKLGAAAIVSNKTSIGWFQPDMPGIYVLSLTVKGHGASYTDEIGIRVVDADEDDEQYSDGDDSSYFVIKLSFRKDQYHAESVDNSERLDDDVIEQEPVAMDSRPGSDAGAFEGST